MEVLSKGTLIDGCAGTETIDSQGERLDIEGCDISALENATGRFNDNHSKSFSGSLGHITGAKKIFKFEDCDDDRQVMYWNKLKKPYIYVKGELFDDTDHANAKAAASIMKHLHKKNAPISVKMSVEGAVLARKDGGILNRTKVHSVALTFTPANKETLAMPMSLEKSDLTEVNWEELIKSVSVVSDVPCFIQDNDIAAKLTEATGKIVELLNNIGALKKALSAGYSAGGAPSSLTGGSVLMLSSLDKIYTSCPDCGKRQIIKKSQTGCSFCKNNWTMDKIVKHLVQEK